MRAARAADARYGQGWMFDGPARHRLTVPDFEKGQQRLAAAMKAGSAVMRQPPATPIAEGPHVIITTATDRAGNDSEPSTPFAFTVDTTPPSTAPTIGGLTDDDLPLVKGPVANGGITNDPSLSLPYGPQMTEAQLDHLVADYVLGVSATLRASGSVDEHITLFRTLTKRFGRCSTSSSWRLAMSSACSQLVSGLSDRLKSSRMASIEKPSSRAWRMKVNLFLSAVS